MGINLKLKLGVIDVPEPNGNTSYGVGNILEEGYLHKNPFISAGEELTLGLKKFIYQEELAGKVAGVPTQAALEGVTTRKVGRGKKSKFKRTKTGVRRPSFIDSGIFEASTKVWIE